MNTITTTPEINGLKARLKETWTAGDYDRCSRYMEQGARIFYEQLDVPAGCQLLDVACGSGQVALWAARDGVNVTGVDIAPNLVQRAQARAKAEGLNARFREGDAEALPFEDASFDVVTSLVGAMFAPRPQLVARELLRVCSPVGTIAMGNWTREGAATPHLIPTATQRRNDARDGLNCVVADAAPRRLPRNQPRDGVALRGGAGDAGAEGECGGEGARSDRSWPRFVHWNRGGDRGVSRYGVAARGDPLLRRRASVRSWNLLPGAPLPSALGPHAGGLSRPDGVVVSDGNGARCWFNVAAGVAGQPNSRSG
jgi:SAM-dependent methyltransferase